MKIRTLRDHPVNYHGVLILPEGTEITDPHLCEKLRNHPQFEVVETRKKNRERKVSYGDHET